MKNTLGSLMSFFSAEENSQQIDTHWISESGIIDVFVLLGPKPHDVFRQYAALTGTTALPPVSRLFTLVFKMSVSSFLPRIVGSF